jgi:hypothetical protein
MYVLLMSLLIFIIECFLANSLWARFARSGKEEDAQASKLFNFLQVSFFIISKMEIIVLGIHGLFCWVCSRWKVSCLFSRFHQLI